MQMVKNDLEQLKKQKAILFMNLMMSQMFDFY